MRRILFVALPAIAAFAAVLLAFRQQPAPTRSVTITWQAPASANGSAPLRYNVYRSDDAGRSFPSFARRVEETTLVDLTVEPGKSYRYRISTIDARGRESMRSEMVEIAIPK
jgi:fibronectin type 3 domain-containing protein